MGSNALIMGSEDKGIQPGIMKVINDKVKLPMGDKMASLNVSVACGIILFEMLRQEQFVQINLKMNIPLAERMRPKSLDEYLGQQHLIGSKGALTPMLRVVIYLQ